ncbi:MAG: hypothetical protein CMC96_08060 [Flavobacteriales bacterium]|nr:hypothetical protein [Flavobacteriales bacterium]|tara:strand:- start:268 stop:1353 length:1086 start_codon:yes stop_codon:yes gene_type:complete
MGYSWCRLIIIFCINSFPCFNQNLIFDPGFEVYRYCPKGVSDMTLNYWIIPTKGTTDYFNFCSRKMHPDRNLNGFQETKEGDGYIGLGGGKQFLQRPTAEYIQTRLVESLKEGETYYLEFYVSLADYSMQVAKNIGALFSASKLSRPTSDILNLQPQIKTSKYIIDTTNWVKVSGEYIAEGSEQYLTIGIFGDKNSFKKLKRKKYPRKKFAYYYVDNVCLINMSVDTYCKEVITKKSNETLKEELIFDKVSIITLPDFTFETGKWIIAEDKVPLLDSLADYLKLNKKAEIVIEGYTDNIGKEEENQLLSEKRAESVMEYLLNIGIGESRITTIGFGSQHPVSSNSTAVGRSKNRRVEIKIE